MKAKLIRLLLKIATLLAAQPDEMELHDYYRN